MVESQKKRKELNISELQRKQSSSRQIALSKEELLNLDPEEVFGWKVEKLDEFLKVLGVIIARNWSNSINANESNQTLLSNGSTGKPKMPEISTDPNIMMIQMLSQNMENVLLQAQSHIFIIFMEEGV